MTGVREEEAKRVIKKKPLEKRPVTNISSRTTSTQKSSYQNPVSTAGRSLRLKQNKSMGLQKNIPSYQMDKSKTSTIQQPKSRRTSTGSTSSSESSSESSGCTSPSRAEKSVETELNALKNMTILDKIGNRQTKTVQKTKGSYFEQWMID